MCFILVIWYIFPNLITRESSPVSTYLDFELTLFFTHVRLGFVLFISKTLDAIYEVYFFINIIGIPKRFYIRRFYIQFVPILSGNSKLPFLILTHIFTKFSAKRFK